MAHIRTTVLVLVIDNQLAISIYCIDTIFTSYNAALFTWQTAQKWVSCFLFLSNCNERNQKWAHHCCNFLIYAHVSVAAQTLHNTVYSILFSLLLAIVWYEICVPLLIHCESFWPAELIYCCAKYLLRCWSNGWIYLHGYTGYSPSTFC